MRDYDYLGKWEKLLTPQVVKNLTTIHEYRGELRSIVNRHAELLADLSETAKIQSTKYANKMSGISISDERLRKIVLNKTMPENGEEREIAGYRDVLQIVREGSAHLPVKSTFILQLHKELYQYGYSEIGGVYKGNDKMIAGQEVQTCCMPLDFVPALEIPESIDRLCMAYHDAVNGQGADALLLIPMFVLDFLCTHPFRKGNGRMSRLLMLLLLYQTDYIVGRYISMEKLMEETKDLYCASLWESAGKWYEGENDYQPFVNYILGVIASAHREFLNRTRLLEQKKIAKPGRVEEEIKNCEGMITKAEIMKRAAGVSQTTIQRTLTELVKQEKIIKIGNGRYTKYTWNREDNGE